MPEGEWHARIEGHHEGYITLEEFAENELALEANRLDKGNGGANTPAREGPSLLQGLVYCGICGCAMHVNYQHRTGRTVRVYRLHRR